MRHSKRRKVAITLLSLVAILVGLWLILRTPRFLGEPDMPFDFAGPISEQDISSSFDHLLGVRFLASKDTARRRSWFTPGEQTQLPPEIVLLVHGLDEPGDIWDDLAPAVALRNFHVARFDYRNDQRIANSTDDFAEALRDLRARGVKRLTIVAHSMGGLVARDALTRDEIYGGDPRGPDDLPKIMRLITIGTPNRGSPFAPMRVVAEIRERFVRWMNDGISDEEAILGGTDDGAGAAGEDLTPGSDFLDELNSRPLPRNLEITIIAGRLGPIDEKQFQLAEDDPEFEDELERIIEEGARTETEIVALFRKLGDGVVPVDSTQLEGVTDYTMLFSNHRSMLFTFDIEDRVRSFFGAAPAVPPAVPIVIDRLEADRQP